MTSPLTGLTILIVRPSNATPLARRLVGLGARVLALPATRIERLDPTPLRAALARLGDYGWIVFTSANAVSLVVAAMREQQLDARLLARCKIAVVGRATARALTEIGVPVHVIPEEFRAEGLVDAMAGEVETSTRILYPSAEGARDTLSNGLRALGAIVDVVACYRSVVDDAHADALRTALASGAIDLTVLTAPSSARSLAMLAGDAGARARAVTIGRRTTAAAARAGFDVIAEAAESSEDGLVDAILTAAQHPR
jgi:uroporphyrinogen III methyltransferase/synthase